MKIKYDSKADVIMLTLRDAPPADAIEEPGGVIVSYGDDGEPVSVEFLNASARHLTILSRRQTKLHIKEKEKTRLEACRL